MGVSLDSIKRKTTINGALATVFGAHGEHVTRPGDLEDAIRQTFASGKPTIVDVMIDENALAPVVFRP